MSSALEDRIRILGREIFARLDRGGPMPLTRAWANDQLMNLSMGHEALKVQLFRFVDTLPYLHDPADLARHLREYLSEAKADLPWWARHGIRFIPRTGLLANLLAKLTRANAGAMARKFIAGSNIPEAIDAVRRLRAEGQTFTVDLLGEATVTEPEADHVQKQYFELLAGLAELNDWPEAPEIDRDDRGPIPRVNVSVKLSALYSQFDPIDPDGTTRAVLNRLRPILSAAKRTGAFVNFDMEQHAFKDTTLKIFRDVLTESEFKDWPHVGIAMQAYLTDTERDLQSLLDWTRARGTPIGIRLVKGAYWDYETVICAQQDWPVPVFTRKWQSDASFERCSRFLLQNSEWMVPAFGSHNIRSMAHAMAVAEELNVPPRRYEFQMLYGMADPLKASVSSLGHRVRIYTPYGQLLPGMAYLVRRLLENTSNDSFLRQGFAEGIPEEVLLMNPESRSRESGDRGQGPGEAHGRTSVGRANVFKNEPLTDFACEENRAAMARALESVRAQLGQSYSVVIDNHSVPTMESITSVNPSRIAEIVGTTGAASKTQANQAVASCRMAFESWRDTPVAERAALLRRTAAVFRRRRFELAAWIVLEVGKPWREADADVAEAIDFCEYYAIEGERLQGHDVNLPGEANAYFYEPRGVAVVIAPWNFPLAILCGMATAALVTGNTVILKPAEQSSVVGAKLMECFLEAGVPPGVVNFVPGVGEEIGPVLVEHPDVALIAFTGSLKVALAINASAAKTPPGQSHVKKVIAEMGGKNAIIVDNDADLDEAVRGVVDAAFGYAGQKCSAGSRVIVLAGIYDQFLARLVEATKSLTVGPAEYPGSSLGPVIDRESQQRLLRSIEVGTQSAKLVHRTDVGELAERGYFVGPTIFADVPEDSALAQDEFFGPVLSVMKAKDLEDALRIANGVQYALTGAVYSRSPENIATVKRRFRVGNLYVNRKCTGALVNRQPFGGFKLSGIGSKAGGPDYLLQFVLPRTITENTMRRGFAPETS
ncbi:MAG: L-glutamate gamma-semialdehyde dehydrogenase [Planctomycetia bacterium]|nr:L-glutamate gamma-semialdehyde dehydrogenase [Planctomycetia bacterium]